MLNDWTNFICDNIHNNLLLITVVLIISWYVLKFILTPKNLPPGPWGVPIIGYVPFLGKKPHITIANLKEKFGDVIRINFGFAHVIFLTSFTAVKEALVKQGEHYAARPDCLLPCEIRNYGIATKSGKIWSEYRQFSLSTLRDLGFGKSSLEPKIMEEIDYFINDVKSLNGQAADINKRIHSSVTNVICVIISGHRFEYDNPKFLELLHSCQESFNTSKIGQVTDFLPAALQKQWLFNLFGIKTAVPPVLKIIKLLSELIEDHKKTFKVGNDDNFISAWLNEQEKRGPNSKVFSEKDLPGVMKDLFLAGSDSTTSTLQWSLLYMIKYPEIQTKVQQEIDEVIGRERTPTMADQKLMPYTEATLMELQRITSIAPLALLHSTTKDTSLFGYFIPKDSMVVPNLWAIHHDPEIFSQPNEFKPERFLSDEKQLKRVEALIPFSMGKRQCMGESLVRMELFLYFTRMLQIFTFKSIDGVEMDFDYSFALVSYPKPQPLCATPR